MFHLSKRKFYDKIETMKIIEVENLVKKYKDVTAVDDVTFSVKDGEFFAFLGPNGAGKSTIINILCTTISASGGKAYVAGHDVSREKQKVAEEIGVVFQNGVLDQRLSVGENLQARAALYGISGKKYRSSLAEIEQRLELADILKRPYGKLSGGQRRRADIARAMIHRPKILFLDEPTTGLDPQTRKMVWDAVKRMKSEFEMTIFLTTHYMEESEVCDNVAIIDGGKLVAEGTPADLKIRYGHDSVILFPKDSEAVKKYLKREKIDFSQKQDEIVCPIKNTLSFIKHLNEIAEYLLSYEVKRGDMDDVFLNITGKELRE